MKFSSITLTFVPLNYVKFLHNFLRIGTDFFFIYFFISTLQNIRLPTEVTILPRPKSTFHILYDINRSTFIIMSKFV